MSSPINSTPSSAAQGHWKQLFKQYGKNAGEIVSIVQQAYAAQLQLRVQQSSVSGSTVTIPASIDTPLNIQQTPTASQAGGQLLDSENHVGQTSPRDEKVQDIGIASPNRGERTGLFGELQDKAEALQKALNETSPEGRVANRLKEVLETLDGEEGDGVEGEVQEGSLRGAMVRLRDAGGFNDLDLDAQVALCMNSAIQDVDDGSVKRQALIAVNRLIQSWVTIESELSLICGKEEEARAEEMAFQEEARLDLTRDRFRDIESRIRSKEIARANAARMSEMLSKKALESEDFAQIQKDYLIKLKQHLLSSIQSHALDIGATVDLKNLSDAFDELSKAEDVASLRTANNSVQKAFEEITHVLQTTAHHFKIKIQTLNEALAKKNASAASKPSAEAEGHFDGKAQLEQQVKDLQARLKEQEKKTAENEKVEDAQAEERQDIKAKEAATGEGAAVSSDQKQLGVIKVERNSKLEALKNSSSIELIAQLARNAIGGIVSLGASTLSTMWSSAEWVLVNSAEFSDLVLGPRRHQ